MAGERSRATDRRGLSEITGLVLLIGLVIVGAVIVILTGTAVQEGVNEQSRIDAATSSIQEVDAELTSLSDENSPTRVSLEPAPREGESVSVLRGDEMTITIEGDETASVVCQETVALDALEHTGAAENVSIVYQAGAVWRQEGDQTVMISPPAVGFREGTLELSLVKLTSGPGTDLDASSGFGAERLTEKSRERSEDVRKSLFSKVPCKRPATVILEIETEFTDAWEMYLEDEMPSGTAISRPGPDTVRVEIDDSLLAQVADDDRNGVVNFTNGDPSDGEVLGDGVRVNKGISREYDAQLQYVTARVGDQNVSVTYGTKEVTSVDEETRTVEEIERIWDNDTVTFNRTYWDNDTVTTNETRIDGAPLDVTFVIDESQSMDSGCGLFSPPSCKTRIEYAVDATDHFLDELPDNKTRAGLVGYSWRSFLGGDKTELYQPLTEDKGAVRSSLSELDTGGQTPIGSGLQTALDDFSSSSDPDHDRVVILLSDGQHNRGPDPLPEADRAASMDNVTIHTVGVGGAVDESLMQDIADRTGGKYRHVDNASDLDDVFQAIIRDETTNEKNVSRLKSEWVTVPVEDLEEVARRDTVTVRNYTTETVIDPTNVTYDHTIVRKPAGVQYDNGGDTDWAFVSGSDVGIDRAVNYAELFGTVSYGTTESLTVEDGDAVRFDAVQWDCTSETSAPGSETHPVTGITYDYLQCAGLDTSSSMNVIVRTHGQDIPTGTAPDTPWWQSSVVGSVPGQYKADLDGDPGMEFDLASNQVAVVAQTVDNSTNGPGGVDYNNVVMIYEMGDSGATSAEWIIDIEVDVIEVEAESGS